jgi:hypothetical protein
VAFRRRSFFALLLGDNATRLALKPCVDFRPWEDE